MAEGLVRVVTVDMEGVGTIAKTEITIPFDTRVEDGRIVVSVGDGTHAIIAKALRDMADGFDKEDE
ncbi:hypothetical protein SEA_MARGARET_72 [Gordonia phage Margaret]|nr:hypothetical protein SEA_MARGARET_72 [Gordonia phage Margaret]